jgi:hypothetical protein
MKMRIRKTGAAIKSEPISHQAWRGAVDDFDTVLQAAYEQDTEEAAVEAWLECPQEFLGSDTGKIASPMARRVPTGGTGLRRAGDPSQKLAAASNWDEEFANTKAHAASVLKRCNDSG